MDCSICFEKLIEDTFLTECKHNFHIECLDKWTDNHNECPLCRNILRFSYTISLTDGQSKSFDNNKKIIKYDNLNSIIKQLFPNISDFDFYGTHDLACKPYPKLGYFGCHIRIIDLNNLSEDESVYYKKFYDWIKNNFQ